MCLPQAIKSFQNYRGVATTFYPTLVQLVRVTAQTNKQYCILPLGTKLLVGFKRTKSVFLEANLFT